METGQKRKFEDELAELEGVVESIDAGELALEDAIAAYERGVGLVRSLNQKLDEIDRRVEVLTSTGSGELRTAAYQGEGVPPPDATADDSDDDF